MEKPLRVLQLLGGGKAIGGVEKMLLNYYSRMDRKKVVFDFCFYRENTFDTVCKEFSDILQDSKIFELKAFSEESSLVGYTRSIAMVKQIIKDNNYSIVHINAGRPPLLVSGLIASTLAGANIRIVHSHNTKGVGERGFFGRLFYDLFSMISRLLFNKLATYYFGCSTEAGEYMFGRKAVLTHRYFPVHNAINVEQYKFDPNVRSRLRTECNIDNDTILFGHIGRFSKQKNHLFLIDVFNEIHKLMPNTKLWLVGEGDENIKKEVIKRVNDYDMCKTITMLGARDDINLVNQAIDAMIFPSTYEGLSVVLVEAQAAALPIYTSTELSPEHSVTDLVKYLDLKEGARAWAEFIVEDLKKLSHRVNTISQIRQNGYDIDLEAITLQQLYLDFVK